MAVRQQVKQASPNTPQHQACLDVIQEGIVHGGYNGVLKVNGQTGRAGLTRNTFLSKIYFHEISVSYDTISILF